MGWKQQFELVLLLLLIYLLLSIKILID